MDLFELIELLDMSTSGDQRAAIGLSLPDNITLNIGNDTTTTTSNSASNSVIRLAHLIDMARRLSAALNHL
jgi:hypothetical protein